MQTNPVPTRRPTSPVDAIDNAAVLVCDFAKAIGRVCYLRSLPSMPLAIFPAKPVVEKAVPAILDAWLNLSHREKARELVTVRTIAIAVLLPLSSAPLVLSALMVTVSPPPKLCHSPTSGSQMNMSRTSASTASATHSSGWT